MPNSYYRATMSPDSIHLSPMHQAYLKMTGAQCELEDDGRFYVTWGESLNEDIGDFQIEEALEEGTITQEQADFIGKHSFNEMLRHVLYRNPTETHILIEGAQTCSRMLPGMFGGAVVLVTRTEHLDLYTGCASYDQETGKIAVNYQIKPFPVDNAEETYLYEVGRIGDLMSVEEFILHCREENLIDSDGYGNPVKNNKASKQRISPSTRDLIPQDATHILWLNS